MHESNSRTGWTGQPATMGCPIVPLCTCLSCAQRYQAVRNRPTHTHPGAPRTAMINKNTWGKGNKAFGKGKAHPQKSQSSIGERCPHSARICAGNRTGQTRDKKGIKIPTAGGHGPSRSVGGGCRPPQRAGTRQCAAMRCRIAGRPAAHLLRPLVLLMFKR